MLEKKNAQGLSITTIIIAIIGLIVLVVLVGIFSGGIKDFTSGVEGIGDVTKTCSDQGGTQKEECDEDEAAIISSDAIAKGKKCCKTPP